MNTVRPLISFVIPCYNVCVDWLMECLDSIFSLPLSAAEREVILVDDGSVHSPFPHLAAYAGDICCLSQKNSGPGIARNTGMDAAHGTYIQFVDADDVLLVPGYLHCLELLRTRHPDVIYFGYTSDLAALQDPLRDWHTDGVSFLLSRNLRVAPWGYLFRNGLQIRFPEYLYHEDEDFTPRLLLKAGTMTVTTSCAYYYRTHDTSLMSMTDKSHVDRNLSDFVCALSGLKKLRDELTGKSFEAMSRRVAQLTMDYIYTIIMRTGSYKVLRQQVSLLRHEGLYPLPKASYTWKYVCFRWVSGHVFGLFLLTYILSLFKRR